MVAINGCTKVNGTPIIRPSLAIRPAPQHRHREGGRRGEPSSHGRDVDSHQRSGTTVPTADGAAVLAWSGVSLRKGLGLGFVVQAFGGRSATGTSGALALTT